MIQKIVAKNNSCNTVKIFKITHKFHLVSKFVDNFVNDLVNDD